jgi:quinohemoprotein ethanol dehydrogenase
MSNAGALASALAAASLLWAPSAWAAPAAAGSVDASRLARADIEPGQWLTTGRDQSGSYYSTLSQINTATAKDLGFAWDFKVGSGKGLQATPLLVDGVMYTSGPWGTVYALDGASGKLIWSYNPKSDGQRARYQQNDVVNRGVVVWKGRVYVLAADCRLIALDAATGSPLWDVSTLADKKLPYACSGAPQLAGDVIVVGNAGADTTPAGLRGYVSAFDLATGALRWRFYTVPSVTDTTVSPEMTAAARTWDPKRQLNNEGGGNVWNGMAYDPSLGLIYLGTGNAAPYAAPRTTPGSSGDNLYTASIVALHAQSGKYAWHFQTTPGDRWDYDAAATMVLADLNIAGKPRAVLLQANKNGYFYVIDRVSGKPISAGGYAYANWASRLDKNFRPQLTEQADYIGGAKLIYPSAAGAHSWTPMSFSPRTGLAYIPAIDAPNFLIDLNHNPGAAVRFIDEATSGSAYVVPDRDYDPAYWKPIVGSLPPAPASNPKTGKAVIRSSIKAWDPVSQKVVWEQQTSEGYLMIDGGTMSTAGDLVFAGREDGTFVVYDARTGAVLKTLETGTPMMAAPMTYEINGTQYVAIMAAHGGGYLASFAGTAAMKYLNEGRVIAFRLGGGSSVPKPPLRPEEPLRLPPPSTATAQAIESGQKLFSSWCARCHAFGVPGVTPDLSRLPAGIDNIAVFQAVVLKGAFVSQGMARFDDVLSPEDTAAIHAFLIKSANDNFAAQAKAGSPR